MEENKNWEGLEPTGASQPESVSDAPVPQTDAGESAGEGTVSAAPEALASDAQQPASGETAAAEPAAEEAAPEVAPSHSDAASDAPVQPLPEQPRATGVPTAVKVLIVVAVIAILAGIVMVVKGFGSPQKKVEKAFAQTGKAMQSRVETLKEEVPAFAKMQQTAPEPGKTDFDFRLKSAQGGLDESTQQLLQLLSGLGLQGSYTVDPENAILECDIDFAMEGAELLGLYFFLSPDLAAFNVPTFSDTVLSVNPQTLVDDVHNHPIFSQFGFTDEEIQELADALNSYTNTVSEMDNYDVNEMRQEMVTILKGTLKNATYQSNGTVDGMASYTINIPGADVKSGLIALCRYIYIDAPFAKTFDDLYTAEFFEGLGVKSFTEFAEQYILDPMESDLPDLDTVVTLQVNDVIRSAQAVITPSANDMFSSIVVDFSLTEDLSESLVFTFDTEADVITVNVRDQYTDGFYVLDLDASLDSDLSSLQFNMNMKMGKDGFYGFSFHLDASDDILLSENMSMRVELSGTIVENGDKTEYHFPDIQLYLNESFLDAYQLDFTYDAVTTPINTPHVMSKVSTSLFDLDSQQLQTEFDLYESGLMRILMMMMYGSNPGLFSAA